MEQWTIVIVLLTIAIILLFASFFVKDNDRKFVDEMSEYTPLFFEQVMRTFDFFSFLPVKFQIRLQKQTNFIRMLSGVKKKN